MYLYGSVPESRGVPFATTTPAVAPLAVNHNMGGYGGGIRTDYGTGTLTISDTTISGNHAGDSPAHDQGGSGGGLYLAHIATLTGVTLSGNQAGDLHFWKQLRWRPLCACRCHNYQQHRQR